MLKTIKMKAFVSIIMGSTSDLPIMEEAIEFLKEVGKFVKNIGGIGIMWSNKWGKKAHECHDQYNGYCTNGSFIMKKPV